MASRTAIRNWPLEVGGNLKRSLNPRPCFCVGPAQGTLFHGLKASPGARGLARGLPALPELPHNQDPTAYLLLGLAWGWGPWGLRTFSREYVSGALPLGLGSSQPRTT